MTSELADSHLKIAVVGAGVAGVVSAHLLQRRHDVTLFEKNAAIGGHTNTVVIGDGPDAGTAVDTGFIVLNDDTYPLFKRFLAQLNVATRKTCMSFGFHCEESGFEYAGTDLNGVFAQRANLASPRFWGMIRDVMRFNREALEDLNEGRLAGQVLIDYLRRKNFGDPFINDYAVPMGGAIWSTPAERMLFFPAETYVRFFFNHGLLRITNRPTWQTVRGGSHEYLKAFLASFKGRVVTNAGIESVRRESGGAAIRFHDGREESFDRVVIAAHADEALKLLADPSQAERDLLGAWTYEQNTTVLHTDESVMPRNKRAHASWNYTRERRAGDGSTKLSVTYDMTHLQGLTARKRYLVTLNRRQPVAREAMLREFHYTHPQFTFDAIESQKRLPELNGVRGTYFCGSYHGYGFHEDAVRSGVAVGAAFGIDL